MIATALFDPETPSVSIGGSGAREFVREQKIAMQVEVSADKRRIFEALTLPEYIEAWFSLPCGHSNCQTFAAQADKSFQLDHYVSGDLNLRITGSYRTCRRGKMAFTWRKTRLLNEQSSMSESLVLIRLRGAFARSTVHLSHTGLFSESEYRWHCDLWDRSLKKLQALF